jgi:hypothetical protein
MKTFTAEEVEKFTNPECARGAALEEDNHGQQIIYTGVFRWTDGTFRNEIDPNFDGENDDE